ncbi:MAG: NAD(P)-binding domain-containing protein, partial [Aestuariivirgaceae bacterium]
MQIGIVGLGRMGSNIAKRLMRAGHECVVQDIDPARAQELVAEGAKTAETLGQLTTLLRPPRIIWLMLPAGKITDGAVTQLGQDLS